MYVIIAGAGKVGWNLARELIGRDQEVTSSEIAGTHTRWSAHWCRQTHARDVLPWSNVVPVRAPPQEQGPMVQRCPARVPSAITDRT